MANFFVTYDLNGSRPTHDEVDKVLSSLGAARGRVLETVWYVGWAGTGTELYDAIAPLFSTDDQLLVIEAAEVWFHNLLVTDESVQARWLENA